MFIFRYLLSRMQKYKRLLASPALPLAPLALILMLPQPAHAHAIAGNRIFPATLEVDDPSVATELTLPAVSWARGPLDDNGNFPNTANIGAEFDLLVAPNLAVGISNGWNSQTARGERGVYGFDSISVSGKYLFYENDDREILMSAGLKVDIGGTGASSFGDDGTSTFTPTLYFGKGLGDLPDSMALLKPFAITGTLGVAIAQNRNNPDVFQPGFTLQYSMPYLKSAVKDYDLPDFVNHLVPVIEVPLSVGLNNGAHTWGGTIDPGVIYMARTWQFAVEVTLPLTAGDQHGVGVTGDFHVFLDDLVPAFFQPLTGGI
jgi:hypothetical protein